MTRWQEYAILRLNRVVIVTMIVTLTAQVIFGGFVPPLMILGLVAM